MPKGKKKDVSKAVAEVSYASTAEVPVPKGLVEQVVGQAKAVGIIKKAAMQKRNVLLIGAPGTGKSLLAQAMAELMPVRDLEDILVVNNPLDENRPKIRVVRAGDGKRLIDSERSKMAVPASNANLLVVAFMFIALFFLLTFGRSSMGDVITAAMLIGLFVMGAMVMFAYGTSTYTAGAGHLQFVRETEGRNWRDMDQGNVVRILQ